MPMAAMEAYTGNLALHQAELKMVLFDVIGTLFMEKGDRQKQIRKWERMAGVRRIDIVPPAMLKMAGVGVTFVNGGET